MERFRYIKPTLAGGSKETSDELKALQMPGAFTLGIVSNLGEFSVVCGLDAAMRYDQELGRQSQRTTRYPEPEVAAKNAGQGGSDRGRADPERRRNWRWVWLAQATGIVTGVPFDGVTVN